MSVIYKKLKVNILKYNKYKHKIFKYLNCNANLIVILNYLYKNVHVLNRYH